MGQLLCSAKKAKNRVTPAHAAVSVGIKTSAGLSSNEHAVLTAVPVKWDGAHVGEESLSVVRKAAETFKETYVDGSTQAQCDAWNALVEAFVEWYGPERCKDSDVSTLYDDAITGLGLKTEFTVDLKNHMNHNALFRMSAAGVGKWEGGKHVMPCSRREEDAQERWKTIHTLATYGSRETVQELIREIMP